MGPECPKCKKPFDVEKEPCFCEEGCPICNNSGEIKVVTCTNEDCPLNDLDFDDFEEDEE